MHIIHLNGIQQINILCHMQIQIIKMDLFLFHHFVKYNEIYLNLYLRRKNRKLECNEFSWHQLLEKHWCHSSWPARSHSFESSFSMFWNAVGCKLDYTVQGSFRRKKVRQLHSQIFELKFSLLGAFFCRASYYCFLKFSWFFDFDHPVLQPFFYFFLGKHSLLMEWFVVSFEHSLVQILLWWHLIVWILAH